MSGRSHRPGRRIVPLRSAFLLLVVWLGVGGRTWAASPRDDLLRLVPDDVGFCVVIEDLRGYAGKLIGSPVWKAFLETEVGRRIARSPESERVTALDRGIRQHTGIGLAEVVENYLGDAVVFVYRPGPPGKPDKEQGMMLLRARDGKALAAVFDRFNVSQRESGDLKGVESRTHLGAPYSARVGATGTHFCYLHDAVLVLSGQEDLIRRVIELDQSADGKTAPAAADPVPPVVARFRALGLDRAAVQVWLNPRAFDGVIAAKANVAREPELPPIRLLQGCWSALDGLGLSAAWTPEGAELTAHVAARPEQLPPAVRRWLGGPCHGSPLSALYQDRAMVSVVGRVNARETAEVIGELLPAKSRAEAVQNVNRFLTAALGYDVFTEILPALGPDWGGWVLVPHGGPPALVPETLAAVRLQPTAKSRQASYALFRGISALAMVAVVAHNGKGGSVIQVRSFRQGETEVCWLDLGPLAPAGVRPAWALKWDVRDGYFVFASTPDEIERFRPGPPAPDPSPGAPREQTLVRVNLALLGEYVKPRRHVLITVLAQQNHLSVKEADERTRAAEEVLGLFDRFELTRADGDRLTTVKIRARVAPRFR